MIDAWQKLLSSLGYTVAIDGVWGPQTEAALRKFCSAHGVDPSRVGLPPLANPDGLPYPFLPAVGFNHTQRSSVNWIVIHTMEAPESSMQAANVAAWFAAKSAPRASAHYCVDQATVIQCVSEKDLAWHASSANTHSIGIEHAGYASRTMEQWALPASRAALELSAELAAGICARWDIPIVRLDAAALKRGERGFTGHVDCVAAFEKSGHTDPGKGFPYDYYLDRVRSYGPPVAA